MHYYYSIIFFTSLYIVSGYIIVVLNIGKGIMMIYN